MDSADRFEQILQILREAFPQTPSFLEHSTPFELLVSVILSAQTTDAQVNRIMPELLAEYPTPEALSKADPPTVERIIHSVGFFRAKTRRIIDAAKHLLEHHNGQVPETMEELVNIPGVGRKSAGVILHHVYGKPAIIVDTHFGRVSRRLGFTGSEDPLKIEKDVAAVLPEEHWGTASMLLNYHGRAWCMARAPRCSECPVNALCPTGGGLQI